MSTVASGLVWGCGVPPNNGGSDAGGDVNTTRTDAIVSTDVSSDVSVDSNPNNPDTGTRTDPPFTGQTGTILFVTQVPNDGFTTVASTFGNHLPSLSAVPRGGDLMIRYPNGTLRNLTREAGFGMSGMQTRNAIAVREPTVHWSGNKAVFSMVVGAPERQYDITGRFRWQIYEVTGLGQNERAVITKVPNQPENYNNVSPIYGTDDRIIFTSDRPRSGEAHLYPQLDEYESAATVVGIYSLDPVANDLRLLEHAPSGAFSLSIDSSGRIVFVKWDHLQRDQQVDYSLTDQTNAYGAFTYADETLNAQKINQVRGMEFFPEPRDMNDPDYRSTVHLHTFNQFFPWELNQDGSAEETLNHIGRHEFGGTYSEGSFTADRNLTYLVPESAHLNRFYMRGDGGMLHIREDNRNPGTFYASYVPEFGTASGGAILRFNGASGSNPDQMVITPITHPECYQQPDNPTQAPNSTGHYRNPLPMSDGTLIAVHTSIVRGSRNIGTALAPRWEYEYRLKTLRQNGMYYQADTVLTQGIPADVSWWDPDRMIRYQGNYWELDPTEVRPRTRPTARTENIEAPEEMIFRSENVDVNRLRTWLRQRNLALIISRNVTYRDRADVYQPFNLRVPNGTSTTPSSGTVYDVAFMQIFQADAVRGYGGVTNPNPGRRLLARPMHGTDVTPTPSGAPSGSVRVAADGSLAAFVPAQRALSWQLTDPTGSGVVRERNWVSFQSGEIRTCAVCHGINTQSRSGQPVPTNPPEALRTLLRDWLRTNP